jgi:hypothetical protein
VTARLKLRGERPSIPLKDDPTMIFLLPSPRRSGKLRRNNEWSKRSGHNKKRGRRGRRKKECKSRRQHAHEQVKERGAPSEAKSKKERTTRSIYSSSQGAPVMKVTS